MALKEETIILSQIYNPEIYLPDSFLLSFCYEVGKSCLSDTI